MRNNSRYPQRRSSPTLTARRFRVDLPKKQWCDLWHQHFDWDGVGDEGWRPRRAYVSALLNALARARLELRNAAQPCQLFATIHPKSSMDDALYVHTPNPNGTPFPADYGDAKKLVSLPPLLAGRVSLERYAVFAVGQGDSRYFVIEPRGDLINRSSGPPSTAAEFKR